jgi:hypothetical protein
MNYVERMEPEIPEHLTDLIHTQRNKKNHWTPGITLKGSTSDDDDDDGDHDNDDDDVGYLTATNQLQSLFRFESDLRVTMVCEVKRMRKWSLPISV